jgi:Peptidase family M23/Polyglycine hydrolase-like, structural repeat
MGTTFAAVWRQGVDAHYLWEGVSWADFESKWKELSNQNLRLVDLETWTDGGARKWGGVWRQGTDAHYLWVGVNWHSFEAKWKELGRKNLRLVDVEPYVEGGQVKWSGVWREGSDDCYLWVARWPSFEAKWKELNNKDLRLVDVDTFVDGGVRKWVGVWRAGSDAHYFWAGVGWSSFVAKWKELAPKNLRLVDVETYVEGGQRKWAGVWRAGGDGYVVWSAPDAENFLGTWNQLAKEGERLLKFAPLDAACDGCANHVVSRDEQNNPAPYVYYVTGDSGGPYRWPVDDDQYARVSALTFDGKPFTLPFTHQSVNHGGTWLYSPPPGNWHHAIDYSRGPETFEVVAAAAGKVVFIGWDNWSGNTIIVSHKVGGVDDAFRTIYMHLRNGPTHDIDASWNNTVPTLKDDPAKSDFTLTNFKNYLDATGAKQNPRRRNPDAAYWGTDAQKIDPQLLNKHVAAGAQLAWAGCTGPGGCGCTKGPRSNANTHLHIFFAHRDPRTGTGTSSTRTASTRTQPGAIPRA